MKNGGIKTLIVCICMAAAGLIYVMGGGRASLETQAVFENTVSGSDSESESGQPKALEESESLETAASTEAKRILVHVCGEVKTPGVYELDEGSRVFEAVNMAGGYTERAAADFLNMAQPVEDGMKIEVPDEETAKTLPETSANLTSGTQQAEQTGKVNINTAAKEQLMTLRGIGEAKADDIITYRSQNGPFEKIEDIMAVSGIKEAAFQKIKDSITV